MAEDLQGLLDKIQQDGLKKAETERAEIIAAAKEEAKAIVEKAKAEAAEAERAAKLNVEQEIRRGTSAVQQAARDVIRKLSVELEDRLNRILKDGVDAAMTPEMMADIIKTMVASFVANPDATGDDEMKVLVPPAKLDAFEKALKGSLRNSFKGEPQLFADNEIGGGLKVSFNGENLLYDFSDSAISEIICSYIGPRLAAAVQSAE